MLFLDGQAAGFVAYCFRDPTARRADGRQVVQGGFDGPPVAGGSQKVVRMSLRASPTGIRSS